MRARLLKITGGAPVYPLVVLMGLNAVDELDRVAFSVLLPNIRDGFGLDLSGVLALVAAITPVTILVGIPIAYYADRASRVKLATAGAALWAVFSFATGMVVNVTQLGLARVGSGLAKATSGPTHNSLLADYYPVDVRPSVYAVHQGANQVGRFFAPVIAGYLALVFSWRVPFWLFAFPTIVFVVLAMRMKEPRRGVQDRLALGVTQQEAETEETPPSFAEAWRALSSVRLLRRCYVALPFIGASAFGLGSLMSLFYADVFHLNEAERGIVVAIQEPFSVIGLVVGAPIAQRMMRRNPGRVMTFLGFNAVATAITIAGMALAPNVVVAVAFSLLNAAISAILTPGIYSVFSVAIPARCRSLGFVSASLWLLPGVLILPVIGQIGDSFGLRIGMLMLLPLYLVGSFILASAGKFVEADIEMVRVGSMTEQEVRKALEEGQPKLLLARQVDVKYDEVQVLFGVDFDLYPGEIVALLGTNGAGKSTLLKAISGLVDPAGGAIYFDGIDITHRDPLASAALGLVQMPGGRSVFPTLTVAEHFAMAGWTLRDDPEHVRTATEELLEIFPRLRERWDQQAGDLSGGEQQMVGLAMSLIAKPKLLMIDELSLGLAPAIVEQLLAVVRRIHSQGTAIILVEQSVNVALTLAHRAYFMEKGEVRFSGPTAELLERGDILRAVFLQGTASLEGNGGTQEPERVPAAARRAADESDSGSILSVANLSKQFGGIVAVNDVTFELGRGEILGLIGPNGAGKTTIFDLLSGFLIPDAGTIVLDGHDMTSWSPDRRALAGLGRSFQDARIFPSMTVSENLAMGATRHLRVRGAVAATLGLPAAREQEVDIAWTVEDLVELMNLSAFRSKFVSELSTGSRRIVDLAMAIAHNPSVLILDEPSSGIAQRETEALAPLLLRIQREASCSMLIIEHDMPLVTGIADRMLALELGTIIAKGTPSEVTSDPQVVSSYLGGDIAVIQRSGALPAALTATGGRSRRRARARTP